MCAWRGRAPRPLVAGRGELFAIVYNMRTDYAKRTRGKFNVATFGGDVAIAGTPARVSRAPQRAAVKRKVRSCFHCGAGEFVRSILARLR